MLPEIELHLETLRELRGNVLKTLEGVDASGLNWTPTKHETNSLFVLGSHLAGSEHGWIFETLHQGPKTRNRAAEYLAKGDTADMLRQDFERNESETKQVLSSLTESDLGTTRQTGNYGTVTLRWIILHVIRHYSEHIGQMYLTRQLLESR